MKFCANVYDPKWMNPDCFSVPLTFLIATLAAQNFHLFSEVLQHLLDAMAEFGTKGNVSIAIRWMVRTSSIWYAHSCHPND